MTLDTFPNALRDDLNSLGPLIGSRRQVMARDRGRLAAGVLLLALSSVLAVAVYGRVGDRRPVLAMAKTVDPGATIKPTDLVVVRVATDPEVVTVAASARASMVGQRASTRLLVGALLTPDAVGDGPVVADGMAVIGALVKPGQYPAGLRAGDRVEVVVVGAGDRSVPAVITSVAGSTAAGGTPVSLAVPGVFGPGLATAGAESRLLLMVPAR